MKLRGLLFVAVLLTVLAPTPAFSQDQPWLADRKYTVGPGYRVGNFELHPGFATEFGYDSNFFMRASQGDIQGDPVGSMRLRITPSFSFSTLGPQRRAATTSQPPPPLEIFGGVSATYNEFFPVSGIESDQDKLSENRNLSGQADLRLNINSGNPWSGALTANFARLIQPSQEGIVGQGFNRLVPSAGAELIWTPNNGMLDWRLGYNFTGLIFETDRFDVLTNFHHTLQTRGRWRFLPRSALIYDARVGFIQYLNQDGDKSGSMPLRVQLGYNGLITPNFGALVMMGWGSSFYDPSPREEREGKPVEDFDSVIGQAEIRYFLSPTRSADATGASDTTSSFALGFTRDFYDSFIGSYFERDRGYFKLTYYLGGKFVVIVDAGAGALINPNVYTDGVQTAGWTDIRVDAAGFAEYRFKDAFGINATLRYGTRISDKELEIPPEVIGGLTNARDKLQWQQFEAYLGVRWLM